MPCPPQVPISVIPPTAQGQGPLVWQNGNQVTRLNAPYTSSFYVYNGGKSYWGDGSVQAPIYLPNLQEIVPSPYNYFVAISPDGLFVKSSLNGVASAVNLYGGVAGQVPYQSGVNTTSFTNVGATGQLLQSNASGAPTWINPSSLSVNSCVTATQATNATNISNGSGGQIPYQSGSNSTSFVAVGSTGQLLQSNGSGSPSWISQSAITTGKATNIAGGATGSIPVQSSANTTGFLSIGTNGQYLVSNGTNPTWASGSAVSATYNLYGGAAGYVPYQTAANTTGFLAAGTNGYVLTSTGSGITWAPTAPSSTAANISGGAAGDIVYQTGSSTTGFVSAPSSSGQLLASTSTTAFAWQSPSSVSVGTATNLANGASGQIPFQTASGATSFISAGSLGQILESNGSGSPGWVNPSSLSVASAVNATNATNATNIAGGTSGAVVYQAASGTTSSVAGTTGQILKSNGSSAPTWINQSAITAGLATEATNLAGGGAYEIPYQTGSGATSFLSGTSGQILQYNGSSSPPTFVDQNTISAGTAISATTATSATTASNLANGATNQIPYQTGSGATAFVANTASSGVSVLVQQVVGGSATTPAWLTLSAALQDTITPVATTHPAITGTLGFGNVLTCSQGVWTNASTYSYQWQSSLDGVNYSPISGATSSTYLQVYTGGSPFNPPRMWYLCTVTATNGVESASYNAYASTYSTPTLLENLQGYWLGATSTLQQFQDLTGNGYNLTNKNYSSVFINPSSCTFDGTSDSWLEVNKCPTLSSDYTISGWINLSAQPSSGSQANFFSTIQSDGTGFIGGGGLSAGIQCYISGNGTTGNINFVYPNQDGPWGTGGDIAINTGTNYHIVFTRQSSTGTFVIYVNGTGYNIEVDNSDDWTYDVTGNAIILGNNGGQGGNKSINGSLTNVGVWSRCLSSTEVNNLYNGGSALPFSQFGTTT